jgi:hypothetical protein
VCVPWPPRSTARGTRNLVRLTASHLAFPTVEFSMCKRIPPAGCRFAGASGVEPDPRWFWRPDGCPWPRPIACSVASIRNRPPGPLSWGRCRLAAFVSATYPAPLHLWRPALVGTGRHSASRARCWATRYSTESFR